MRLLITTIILLSLWMCPCTANDHPLALETIRLKDIIEVAPEISATKHTVGVTPATGKIFKLNGQRFQIRSFLFEDKREKKDLQQTFAAYIQETQQEDILPQVFNPGYGPISVYHLPDGDHLSLLTIQPEPGLQIKNYPIVKAPITPSMIMGGSCYYSLQELMDCLPHIAQSKPSWLISPMVGQEIVAPDGKNFQVSQAFFHDPLKRVPENQTLKQFIKDHELAKKTTIRINFHTTPTEVYYRPSFDHEDGIAIYIGLAPL